MSEGNSIFNSQEEAQVMLLGKLETLVSLNRAEITIFDSKLEVHPLYGQKNLVNGYEYVGKIQFASDRQFMEDMQFENENEKINPEERYTVVFKYLLSRGTPPRVIRGVEIDSKKVSWILQRAL